MNECRTGLEPYNVGNSNLCVTAEIRRDTDGTKLNSDPRTVDFQRRADKCDARIIMVVSMDTCLHGDNLGSLPGGQSGYMDLIVCECVSVCVCVLVQCIFMQCMCACLFVSQFLMNQWI